MAVREKWPKIFEFLGEAPPLQLRREVARMGMLFRPYMLSDPGFNEGVLEFALYFDLMDRLVGGRAGDLRAPPREIAPLVAMSLKDLRLSALVHMDILTTEETREIVSPFMSRFPSFYEIPGNFLRELILAIAQSVSDRLITYFFHRYSTGRMAMTKPISFFVGKLSPEGEELRLLREDNPRMDSAMMARHLARFLHSSSPR